MKLFVRAVLMAGAVALVMTGCASQQYVQDQVNARIGELEQKLDTVQSDVADLNQRVSKLSTTTQEALSRAQEAGKLAHGRFLYEMKISDASVKFAFNEQGLSPDARAVLDAFASRLKDEDKNVFIEIQGHTDDSGPEQYNLSLGKWRAKSVKRYLHTSAGIPLNRMSVMSYGEEKPLADNGTSEGRAQNRCVVLVVME